jgi:uncharacterized protein (DUF1800 family)
MVPDLVKNQHLLWRAGMGPAASQLSELKETKPALLYKALQKTAAQRPAPIDTADEYLKNLLQNYQEEGLRKKVPDRMDRKLLQQKQRESIKNLNLAWIAQMINGEAPLREKMALFWHGHFASRNVNVFFQQDLLQVIRENALGSFKTLLQGVSKSAAMLNFLNNNQNRKGHPNENFAREVMELFTMGRGNYTEKDVKEAARAFTGWGANFKGEFQFRKFQHDEGSKTVLGKTGNFNGDDVLNLLLEHKQTAHFITQKIYKYFVNEIPDPAKIDELSNRFYNSNYDISKLMEDIFTSDWFYKEENIGVKIKSPIELIVGIQRMLPMEVEHPETFLLIQRVLGQVLFYPPNVAGWPGGTTWIDSSTLMMRMRLPQLISDNDQMNVRPKIDDDQMMGRAEDAQMEANTAKRNRGYGNIGKPIKAQINWESYTKNFDNIPREKLLPVICHTLIQTKSTVSPDIIKNYVDDSSKETFIKTATLQLMSTPEYQMC